jgi:anti-anti-sigma regulatory factor
VRLVVDLTALAALAAVGAAGLIAVSATVGLLVVLVLTITSPAVRRSLRDARTAFRLSLVLTREARRRPRFLP